MFIHTTDEPKREFFQRLEHKPISNKILCTIANITYNRQRVYYFIIGLMINRGYGALGKLISFVSNVHILCTKVSKEQN